MTSYTGTTAPAQLTGVCSALQELRSGEGRLALVVGRTFMLARFCRIAVRRPAWILVAIVGLATGACTVGPKYQRPAPPPLPTAYKEAPPAGFGDAAGWKEAQPNDGLLRGKWWQAFQDPLLNSLEEQVDVSNQNLKQSEAQYRSARAAIRVTRAGLFPAVTAGASVTGAQTASNGGAGVKAGPAANLQLPVQFSYEADVWGRVRSALEGNVATAQATAADLETARLSIHALLAQNYLELRGLDTQHDLLQSTVAAYEKALDLTTNRYKQGVVSKLDVVQAQTQIENTKTQLIDTGVLRAQYEHSIAALLGRTPTDFSIAPVSQTAQPPAIPGVLPAALLERRPDIAGAERRVAAANAQIGVAKAAFYPAIGFSASAGFAGNSLLNWLTWPSRFWSLGPTLAQTLFEAGGRRAVTDQALAAYDGTAAAYRQTVLGAFQEVEDNLSALRILEQESQQQQLAVNSATLSTELSLNQYKGGITTYLQVITAQAIELGDRRTAVDLLTRRMVSSVSLIQALGGGWDSSQLPATKDLLPPGKGFFSKAFPKAPENVPASNPAPGPAPGDAGSPKSN
jgi:NodT family efflux transporter outer membrane factor (OMF) lipoprotein